MNQYLFVRTFPVKAMNRLCAFKKKKIKIVYNIYERINFL